MRAEFAKRSEEYRKEFMKKVDKNQDGKIDEAERKAMRAEFAKRFEEFKAKRKKEAPKKPEPKK